MSTRWTQEQYDAHQRRVSKSVDAAVSHAKPKQAIRQALVSAPQGEGQSESRVVVRITRKACRLLDFDNMGGSVKALLDCLRYAGIIANDDPATIRGEVAQERVRRKGEQGVLVEVSWP
jgi:Holliday junction resolvase RusA-like endonuclease